MANKIKNDFLNKLTERYGELRKIEKSQSLFKVTDSDINIYIRYSKVHTGNRMFYGLREEDLLLLEGNPSVICFLWDAQTDPLILNYADYEEIFQSTTPARDSQFKIQIYLEEDGTELYIAKVGRFNIESNFGWEELDRLVDTKLTGRMPDLSHSNVQTLLGAIGKIKGYDIWIPPNDRSKMDLSVQPSFKCTDNLPNGYEKINSIIKEIDVIWIQRGAGKLRALFEVEHSTPIYSGLLRFNDIHLLSSTIKPRYSIVSNDTRRSTFVKQLNRPTFLISGLNEICTFLEYVNVYGWYQRIKN